MRGTERGGIEHKECEEGGSECERYVAKDEDENVSVKKKENASERKRRKRKRSKSKSMKRRKLRAKKASKV